MKILHLASGDLWAGAEVQLFQLARHLAKENDVDLLIVLLNHGQLEKELLKCNINVSVIDENECSSLQIFSKLNRLVRDFKPEIIHTHRFKENVLGSAVATLRGCKSVRTVHGASELAGNKYSFRRLVLDFIDRISGNFLQKKIISVSEELKGKLSKHFKSSKIEIIENSIDPDFLEQKSGSTIVLQPENTRLKVTFIGRFVPVKRVDKFYDIAKAVLKNNPEKDIHFYMIGDGPLWEELNEKVVQEGYSDNIHLPGFVENTAPYLKQMNLLMFTSDHEGLPMTLLEAMSFGVPVLSRNLATIKQVLCNGGCGYFPDTDDVEQFAGKIIEIAMNKAESEMKAEKAKNVLLQNYSIETNVKKYLSMYKQLIS